MTGDTTSDGVQACLHGELLETAMKMNKAVLNVGRGGDPLADVVASRAVIVEEANVCVDSDGIPSRGSSFL